MRYYSNDEFKKTVDEKEGNIKFFRKLLRELNKLNSREAFNEDHLIIFIEAKKIKEEKENNNEPFTWEKAFKSAIDNFYKGNTAIDIDEKQNDKKETYKFCRNCGNKLPYESKFCDKCGESTSY